MKLDTRQSFLDFPMSETVSIDFLFWAILLVFCLTGLGIVIASFI